MKNYYEILGVSENASFEEIKAAFRSLAKQYHPDENAGNDEATEMFKLINEAYQTLSDLKLREEYDLGLHSSNEFSSDDSCDTSDDYQETTESYEDIIHDYDENTKRMIEREGLKVAIEEQINKIYLIIDAKNDLIINSLIEYDAEKFYNDINDLKDITVEYINSLDELSVKVIESDLVELKDKIEIASQNAYNLMDTFPNNQTECIDDYLKNQLNISLDKELTLLKEKMDELKERILDFCLNVSLGNVSSRDFNYIKTQLEVELNENVNYFQLLKEGVQSLNDEELIKRTVDIISIIDKINIKMPSSYKIAKEIGNYRAKQNLFNTIMENINNGKDEILDDILNLPDDLENFDECYIELNKILSKIESLKADIFSRIKMLEGYKNSYYKYERELDDIKGELEALSKEDLDLEKIISTRNIIDDSYINRNIQSYNMAKSIILNERAKSLIGFIKEIEEINEENEMNDFDKLYGNFNYFYLNILDVFSNKINLLSKNIYEQYYLNKRFFHEYALRNCGSSSFINHLLDVAFLATSFSELHNLFTEGDSTIHFVCISFSLLYILYKKVMRIDTNDLQSHKIDTNLLDERINKINDLQQKVLSLKNC